MRAMTRGYWILWLGIACVAAAAAHEVGLRWNVSSSAASGLYLERSRPVERGDLVAVCLPERVGRWARGRGYLRRGRCPGGAAAIGKRVAALEGDVLDSRVYGPVEVFYIRGVLEPLWVRNED